MGRDQTIYPDPEMFRPERFEEMDTNTSNVNDPRKFVFGFGRRYKASYIIFCVV